MIAYDDIHISDLKNLTIKSFTEILLNDLYPFLFSEIYKIEASIQTLKADYDMDLLESTQKKIYDEFDELFRKEKLVLFPYLLKLDEENKKSENCIPFKNTKLHHTTILQHLDSALILTNHYFINDTNTHSIDIIQTSLHLLKESFTEIQLIKDKYFYKNYKNCSGCKTL